ncbi:MAG: fatty acid--CoA ligase family protein [Acidobacteriaceae bacterium]
MTTSLANAIRESGDLTGRFVQEGDERIEWTDLLAGSALYGRGEELQGRSVLLTVKGQLTTVCALIELDGIARRIVLCPPDLSLEHLPHVIETAEVDGIVSDRAIASLGKTRPLYFSPCSRNIKPGYQNGRLHHETEWVLLTSGTTGQPKLVAHTLSSLTAAIDPRGAAHRRMVWSTHYDIRRYGGLQILLRAALAGTSLVLSDSEESTADFLARAASCGVTHISGTPSQWRRALMSPAVQLLNPDYVRLSGEAVDQAILDRLRAVYPHARLAHAFASTEAGVAFAVDDGLAGFPARLLEGGGPVELKVEGRSLRIRSRGNARGYLGPHAPQLKDASGFVDTGDLLDLSEGRFYFSGRRDGMINVGGLKVHPEEVEAVISRHPEVQQCLVKAKRSRITGSLVVAEVVLRTDACGAARNVPAIQDDILQLCREFLPAHKVPASVDVVPMLMLAGSGKMMRRHA